MLTQHDFGTVQDKRASLFILRNNTGCEAHITDFGATLVRFLCPDRNGTSEDVVLGFDSVEGYAENRVFFGATVGRVANRIEKGAFTLGGQQYQLQCNDPPHHLHGADVGFDQALWQWEMSPGDGRRVLGAELVLSHTSPAGSGGYPGTVHARVRYFLDLENRLTVEMSATTDAPTLVNLAHHSYWNLHGHSAPSVLEHELLLQSDAYTPGAPIVPQGDVAPVAGTPFDFRSSKRIGADIDKVGAVPAGYDHNFVIRGERRLLRPTAELFDPDSGRRLVLRTNQPGLQVYSANFLAGGFAGKQGIRYPQRSAVCLESQGFPNAVNVDAWRDQVLLNPGSLYHHVMIHEFSAT